MNRKLETFVFALMAITIWGLVICGSWAVIIGLLYLVWSGDFLGVQILITGLVATAVGVVGAIIVQDL